MSLTPVVVALELREQYDAPPLVVGLIAIFTTHCARMRTLSSMADLFAYYPLEPVRIPQEEGWYGVADLPRDMWYELQLLIQQRQESKGNLTGT